MAKAILEIGYNSTYWPAVEEVLDFHCEIAGEYDPPKGCIEVFDTVFSDIVKNHPEFRKGIDQVVTLEYESETGELRF